MKQLKLRHPGAAASLHTVAPSSAYSINYLKTAANLHQLLTLRDEIAPASICIANEAAEAETPWCSDRRAYSGA